MIVWGGVGGPCDYCVSPSPKNWIFGFFRLDLNLGVRIWGLLGQGIGDLDLGSTIVFAPTGAQEVLIWDLRVSVRVLYAIERSEWLQKSLCSILKSLDALKFAVQKFNS